jgi:hypothetical protein
MKNYPNCRNIKQCQGSNPIIMKYCVQYSQKFFSFFWQIFHAFCFLTSAHQETKLIFSLLFLKTIQIPFHFPPKYSKIISPKNNHIICSISYSDVLNYQVYFRSTIIDWISIFEVCEGKEILFIYFLLDFPSNSNFFFEKIQWLNGMKSLWIPAIFLYNNSQFSTFLLKNVDRKGNFLFFCHGKL